MEKDMETFVLVVMLTINGQNQDPVLLGVYPSSAECWQAETPQLWRLIDWRHVEERRGLDLQILTMCRRRRPDDPPLDALVRLQR